MTEQPLTEERCRVCGTAFERDGYTINCPGCLDHEHEEAL